MAVFSIKTYANVLQNFPSLLHDGCETFANCFDSERSPYMKKQFFGGGGHHMDVQE